MHLCLHNILHPHLNNITRGIGLICSDSQTVWLVMHLYLHNAQDQQQTPSLSKIWLELPTVHGDCEVDANAEV